MATTEPTVEQARPGQEVVWLQQRKWGGKQNQPAIFLRPVGERSARILVNGVNRTVRLSSLATRPGPTPVAQGDSCTTPAGRQE